MASVAASDIQSIRDGNPYEANPWLMQSFPPMTDSQAKNHLAWRGLQLSKAKLKATSRTSALLSGFAMIAMIELQIDKEVPSALLIAFTVSASVLVAVHILALMISTCILPNLESYSAMYDHNAVQESPHEKMRNYIEIAWIFSTGLGILLFLVVMVLACWVKFWNLIHWAAVAATIILVPIVILFIVFAVLFYRRLVAHKFRHTTQLMDRLDVWMDQLEHTRDQSRNPANGDVEIV